jgi:serine O-acetyltransferase
MNQKLNTSASLAGLARKLGACQECSSLAGEGKGFRLSGRQSIYEVLDTLVAILFPGCHGLNNLALSQHLEAIESRLQSVAQTLTGQIEQAFRYQCVFDQCKDCADCKGKAAAAVDTLLASLVQVKETLQQDIVAAYEGDPAARSYMEVVMSYPGVQAMIVHRIAHVLYRSQVPLIPRIMAEHAHSQTGIDIHPGATIGPGFFIDHGTGVVIGETTTIGKRVKLYQGVTLGALSFPKDKDGNLIKGIKRHPHVEDDVTIYAGATILGGGTTIGEGSEIGGNVWLTHSVPPHSKVYNQQPKPLITNKHLDPS